MMIFVYKQKHKLCSNENYHATTKIFSFALYFFSFSSSRFTLANAQTFQSRDWNLDPVYTAVTVTIFTFLFLVSYVIFYYCFHWFLRSSRAGPGQRAVRPVEPVRGGLDPSVLKTFPVFVYSEVSGLRPGKASLECAVCLSPFEGDETLRLLPKCDHVFHLDCVDPWLAGHVTCPLCLATLEPEPDESTSADPARVDELGARLGGDDDQNEVGNDDFEGRREIDLEGQNGKHRRWYSTGHVASSGRLDDRERFTLSLPVDVQNDILTSKLNRSRSCILRIEGG